MLAGFSPSFPLWHLPVVFLAGFVGEGYASVIGSGSILLQFVLLSLGLPLQNAIATDMAGCLGSTAALLFYMGKNPYVVKNKALIAGLSVPFFLGGIVGTTLLINANVIYVKYGVVTGLVLLLAHQIFRKKNGTLAADARLRLSFLKRVVLSALLFLVGLYNGLSGVGSGTFLKLVVVSALRITVYATMGLTVYLSLPGMLYGTGATALAGLVVWPYCFALWVGAFLGAKYAARYAQKIPDAFLRAALIVLTTGYLFYLLFA